VIGNSVKPAIHYFICVPVIRRFPFDVMPTRQHSIRYREPSSFRLTVSNCSFSRLKLQTHIPTLTLFRPLPCHVVKYSG